MGTLYAMVGFLVVPVVLMLFHQLSRRPELETPKTRRTLHQRRPRNATTASKVEAALADEAERWLRSQPHP